MRGAAATCARWLGRGFSQVARGRWVALLVVLSGLAPTATVSAGAPVAEPALAPEAYRTLALRELGWDPAAAAYVTDRVPLEWRAPLASGWYGAFSDAPPRVTISVPTEPSEAVYEVFSHEYIHAMDFGRGYDGRVGAVLYDLLYLSDQEGYPTAAWAARRALQLRDGRDPVFGGYYINLLTRSDHTHLTLAVLAGVGQDVRELPPWFRVAYFPYLQPGARVTYARPSLEPDVPPADLAFRRGRVLNLMAQWCGPRLAGALAAASPRCDQPNGPRWLDAPGGPLPGIAGRGPAALDALPAAPAPGPPRPLWARLPPGPADPAAPPADDSAGLDELP